MLRFFKEKHIWIIPVYTVFYLVSFYWLEQRDINQFHLIHTPLDDVIPFLPIFIIPYLLWFGYIAAVVAYFALFNKNVKEYWQLMATLGVGMTVFLIISWLYPNMQQLRPVLDGTNGFWTGLVANLYAVDTNTNIFPSIHVFNSIAVCIAIFECKTLKNHKGIKTGCFVLSVLIVLSVMFLKQHSLVDVICAMLLNGLCYILFNTSFLLKRYMRLKEYLQNRREVQASDDIKRML